MLHVYMRLLILIYWYICYININAHNISSVNLRHIYVIFAFNNCLSLIKIVMVTEAIGSLDGYLYVVEFGQNKLLGIQPKSPTNKEGIHNKTDCFV